MKSPKTTGIIFLLIGIITAAVMAFIIYSNAGSDDFYYVTSTINGIQTTEYNPGFVIGMLAFGFLFALAFVIAGIIMIKRNIISVEKYSYTAIINDRTTKFAIEVGDNSHTLPKVFIIIGITLLAIGSGLLAWEQTSLRSLIKTEATVTDTYRIQSGKFGMRTSYANYAVIQYSINGQRYQSRITVSEFFSESNVTVYCDPQNPLICRTSDDFVAWYIILFTLGGMFAFVGILIKRNTKKNRKRLTSSAINMAEIRQIETNELEIWQKRTKKRNHAQRSYERKGARNASQRYTESWMTNSSTTATTARPLTKQKTRLRKKVGDGQ